MAQPAAVVPGQTTLVYHQQPGQVQLSPAAAPTQNPTPATTGFSKSYDGYSGRSTGWIQLCCAVAVMLVGVAQYFLGSPIRYVSTGLWAGLLCYGPAGILGVISYRKKTCVISFYIATSVLSSMAAFVMIVIGAIGAAIGSTGSCYGGAAMSVPCQPGEVEGRVASDGIMSCIGLIEFIVAIVASAYGCSGVCCGKKQPSQVQELTFVTYPAIQQNQQTFPHITSDQPPPYTATPHHQPPQTVPQQIIPQQTHQQQIFQQQTIPQQTFSQQTLTQQTFPHQQTHAQAQLIGAPHQHAYQPLIHPNNPATGQQATGHQNLGLIVDLPQR